MSTASLLHIYCKMHVDEGGFVLHRFVDSLPMHLCYAEVMLFAKRDDFGHDAHNSASALLPIRPIHMGTGANFQYEHIGHADGQNDGLGANHTRATFRPGGNVRQN